MGSWLECHNRHCGFPIRVPYSQLTRKGGWTKREAAGFVFACPVCLHVNSYTTKDLSEVRFRTPDPYQAGRLVLYSVRFGCARPRCSEEMAVLTVGAASVSVAMLLRFWQSWKIKLKCPSGHRFRIPDPETWWIEENKWLAPNGVSLSKK